MVDKQLIYSIIDNKIDILDLSNKNISKEDFNKLLNALHFNKTIKNIKLSNFQIDFCNIEYRDLILLINSFENNTILESLDLSNNDLTFKYVNTFKYIDEYINLNILKYSNKNQKELIVSNFKQINKVIDDINNQYNLNVLIDKLRKFKTLNLSNNYIDNNIDFIIKLLKNNTKLEKLNISYDNIYSTKDDWTYILKDNTILKELSIINNISNKNSFILFENLIKNGIYLTDLSVWLHNEINYNLNEEIADKLKNSSLKSLTINGKDNNNRGKFKKNLTPLLSILKTNTSITKLNLQELSLNKFKNNLEIDNYKLLNELIECNKTINTLEFEEVIFLETEFKNFIQHLYFNKTIKCLKLHKVYLKTDNNNININNEITDLIKNNDTLQSLEINIFPFKKSITFSLDPMLFIKDLKENKTLKMVIY